jgi:hypothetical protein
MDSSVRRNVGPGNPWTPGFRPAALTAEATSQQRDQALHSVHTGSRLARPPGAGAAGLGNRPGDRWAHSPPGERLADVPRETLAGRRALLPRRLRTKRGSRRSVPRGTQSPRLIDQNRRHGGIAWPGQRPPSTPLRRMTAARAFHVEHPHGTADVPSHREAWLPGAGHVFHVKHPGLELLRSPGTPSIQAKPSALTSGTAACSQAAVGPAVPRETRLLASQQAA